MVDDWLVVSNDGKIVQGRSWSQAVVVVQVVYVVFEAE